MQPIQSDAGREQIATRELETMSTREQAIVGNANRMMVSS